MRNSLICAPFLGCPKFWKFPKLDQSIHSFSRTSHHFLSTLSFNYAFFYYFFFARVLYINRGHHFRFVGWNINLLFFCNFHFVLYFSSFVNQYKLYIFYFKIRVHIFNFRFLKHSFFVYVFLSSISSFFSCLSLSLLWMSAATKRPLVASGAKLFLLSDFLIVFLSPINLITSPWIASNCTSPLVCVCVCACLSKWSSASFIKKKLPFNRLVCQQFNLFRQSNQCLAISKFSK